MFLSLCVFVRVCARASAALCAFLDPLARNEGVADPLRSAPCENKVTRRRGLSAVMINSAEALRHGTAAADRWAP